ncbi:Lsr2 protein [Friedmanniella luteola]|uniref:Lsr2 protein n=1 Tax=Friedmanniella luteola TaxID=546871 RepID=A0A1H1WL31_9ACTN|nr:Lsr2 family protein [Friedmanniella luteola]SDS97390.1 Lsr2 protein [Friedmanniella luteola]
MGTRTEVTQFDDIDGSTGDVRTIAIAVDGQQVEVDLSPANVAKLMTVLEPYLSAGRKAGGGGISSRRRRISGAAAASKSSYTQAIREWAQANNIQVSGRGRIKKEVLDAYQAAQG